MNAQETIDESAIAAIGNGGPNPTTLADDLTARDYLRQRWEPRPGDLDYLALSDLRLALQQYASDEALDILDYGCGGSPYRAMFPKARYIRADFDGLALDYKITPDEPLSAPTDSFDLVISTQVLEHVCDTKACLQDLWRMLKPGGQLILSTHGTFRDHGCPYDYHRWTADGLTEELRRVGFVVSEAKKITAGPRALLFLMELFAQGVPKKSSFGFPVALWRW